MKLNHLFESKEPLTPEQEQWMKGYVDAFGIGSKEFYQVNGKIETSRRFIFINDFDELYDNLPEYIRFGKIGIFNLKNCAITNFTILPEESDSINIDTSSEIPESLKGLSKTVKKCSKFQVTRKVKSGLLEMFKISGMKELKIFTPKRITIKTDIELVVDIINKHLQTGDIFECQDELIAAGFKEFC